MFSSYHVLASKFCPDILYLHQIHVILVFIVVVQILCVCSEVMAILNVLVIQVSLEMGKTVVLVSFKNYHTFSVESMPCCGFVTSWTHL